MTPVSHPLDSAPKLARFLARMEYKRQEIVDTLRDNYPEADAEKLTAEALLNVAAEQARMDQLIAGEDASASAAA